MDSQMRSHVLRSVCAPRVLMKRNECNFDLLMEYYAIDLQIVRCCAMPPLELREQSPAAMARIALHVAAILSGPAVTSVTRDLRELLVHPLSAGYTRPLTSSFQHSSDWVDIPAPPGSVGVLFANALDAGSHVAQALGIESTPLSRSQMSVRPDLQGAIEWVASFAGMEDPTSAVSQERKRRMHFLNECGERLKNAESELKDLRCPQAVQCQSSETNMALIACMLRAAGLPDEGFTACQVHGFPTCGEYPDSGNFRQCERPAEQSFTSLNHAPHNAEVVQKLMAMGSDTDPERVYMCEQVTRQTDAEVANGLAYGPFEEDDVDRILGKGSWRALLGFGVMQGLKKDGSVKIRRCDDAAASHTNECVTTHETIACEDASFPSTVACKLAELLNPVPPLQHSTDDVDAAYRRAMCANPRSTVVAIYHTDLQGVRYYLMPGHNFGLVSAVLTWNRYSFLAAALCRRFFGVACAPFYDDYDITEPCFCKRTGKDALHAIHRWLGCPLALGDKDVDPAPFNPFLGVITDFSSLSHGFVTMRSKPDRIAKICVSIERMLDEGAAGHGALLSLCGKLEFTITSAGYQRFGRAALTAIRDYMKFKFKRKFVHAQEGEDLPETLVLALTFFLQLLPRLPSRRIKLRPKRRKPILVYTDASFSRWDGAKGVIGIIIVDLENPAVVHECGAAVPAWLLALFRPRSQYIGQLEALAAVAAYSSIPSLFADREVVHFIDNTGALYGLHHAYSRDADTSKLVHAYYALAVALQFRTWWAYVASAANIADFPSRGKEAELRGALHQAFGAQVTRKPFEVVWPVFSNDWAQIYETNRAAYGESRLSTSAKKALREVAEAVQAARESHKSFSLRSSKVKRQRTA